MSPLIRLSPLALAFDTVRSRPFSVRACHEATCTAENADVNVNNLLAISRWASLAEAADTAARGRVRWADSRIDVRFTPLSSAKATIASGSSWCQT